MKLKFQCVLISFLSKLIQTQSFMDNLGCFSETVLEVRIMTVGPRSLALQRKDLLTPDTAFENHGNSLLLVRWVLVKGLFLPPLLFPSSVSHRPLLLPPCPLFPSPLTIPHRSTSPQVLLLYPLYSWPHSWHASHCLVTLGLSSQRSAPSSAMTQHVPMGCPPQALSFYLHVPSCIPDCPQQAYSFHPLCSLLSYPLVLHRPAPSTPGCPLLVLPIPVFAFFHVHLGLGVPCGPTDYPDCLFLFIGLNEEAKLFLQNHSGLQLKWMMLLSRRTRAILRNLPYGNFICPQACILQVSLSKEPF